MNILHFNYYKNILSLVYVIGIKFMKSKKNLKMMRIGIVDYGVGNLKSISHAVEKKGGDAIITSSPEVLKECNGIILPGVGAFRCAIENLSPIKREISGWVGEKPLLGICLGMQILASESEEGGLHRGLDLIPGQVIKLKGNIKIPHMGWNSLKITKYHELFDGIEEGSYVYFVHSYYMRTDEKFVNTITRYGVDFPSSVAKDSVMGTQFHPEKSGDTGLRIIENFINMCRR